MQNVLNSLLRISLEEVPLERQLERCLDVILYAPFLTLLPKGGIFLAEDETDTLHLKANRRLPVSLQEMCARVPFGRCLCGLAAASREIQFACCMDERHDNRYDGLTPHGHYAVPMLSKGKLLGVFVLYLNEGHQWKKEEIVFLQTVADTLAGVIERKEVEEELQRYSKELMQLAEENRSLIEGLEEKIKERTKEFEEARFQAESAIKAKSDFIADMSHEMRTPLNAIIGFSEVMLDGLSGEKNTEQKEYLKYILDAAEQLLSLINDLLDLSKTEAGKMGLELSEFHLGEILEVSFAMIKEKAVKHKLDLSLEVEEGIETIIADATMIKQIMYYLLGSAVKFTPEGGTISVRARRGLRDLGFGADFTEISIENTGTGISEKDQKKLFQPFQPLNSALTKKHKGTGLGLSICKRLIELHGGRIWTESNTGKGGKFKFVLPVLAEKQHIKTTKDYSI